MHLLGKTLQVLLYITLGATFASSFECELTDNCLCYQPHHTFYSFHCPPAFVSNKVRTNFKEMEVECSFPTNWVDGAFPQLDIDYIRSLNIIKCPFPSLGMEQALQKLGINSTDSIKFSYTTIFGEYLTVSKDFSGLRNLRSLDLSHNKIQEFVGDNSTALKDLELLDLSHNYIKNISAGLLHDLPSLRVLRLAGNAITEFSENLFVLVPGLEELDLSSNPIDWTNTPFKPPSSVEILKLSNTELTSLSEDYFKNLTQLRELDLSKNKILYLPEKIFHPLVNLRKLNLERNLLTKITKDVFSKLSSLEEINLRSNNISVINFQAFEKSPNLKEAIVANNSYDMSPFEVNSGISPFHANLKLERLDLSRNRITQISEDWLLSKIFLKELDLSYNRLSRLLFGQLMSIADTMALNLSHNNISEIDFRLVDEVQFFGNTLAPRLLLLNNNPLICDCNIYHFVKYFEGNINPVVTSRIKIVADDLRCAGPKKLLNKLASQLKSDLLTCKVRECPEECTCEYRFSDRAYIVECSNKNLTEAPTIPNVDKRLYNYTEVNLQGNELRKGPSESMGYENVDKLSLAYNNISAISWIPSKLQMLDLTNNNLEHLDENILYKLTTLPFLSHLSLGNNPWKCGCAALNLRSFMITHLISKRTIDADNVKCKNDGRLLIHLSINDVCLTFSTIIVVSSLALALMASAISIFTCICAFSRRKKSYTAF